MHDSHAKVYLNCAWLAQEILEKNCSMLHRDSSCFILMMKAAAFYSCLKSLSEAKMKRLRLGKKKKSLNSLVNNLSCGY